jgi:GDP-4-dehydro-6-deoxy-D-mannose reductase
MRVLVTGASGFVGPHVLRAVHDAGHEAWGTDRSPRPGSPRHRTCDLADAGQARAMLAAMRPDAVVHLAGTASVARSFDHPQEVLGNNLLAACNLLEAVRGEPGAGIRVLLVGSAEQYGPVRPDELPVGEAHPQRPASPYAVSKVAQEHLALQYRAAWGLDVVLTRSFNHSGPGQSPDFVLPAIARQIAAAEAGAAEPVLHVGNLDVERDFLDVRDVARAYVLLLEKGESGAVYNVCSGEAVHLRALVDALVSRARVAMRIETDPARFRPADLPALRGDPSRLRQATGWERRIPLATTLADVLDDWRRRGGTSGADR